MNKRLVVQAVRAYFEQNSDTRYQTSDTDTRYQTSDTLLTAAGVMKHTALGKKTQIYNSSIT